MVCALSRAIEQDIDIAAEALKVAECFRIHTFIATSALHVETKLRRSFEDVIKMAINAVKHAVDAILTMQSSQKMQVAQMLITFVASNLLLKLVRLQSIFQILWVTVCQSNMAILLPT